MTVTAGELRRMLRDAPDDMPVIVVGTGELSHVLVAWRVDASDTAVILTARVERPVMTDPQSLNPDTGHGAMTLNVPTKWRASMSTDGGGRPVPDTDPQGEKENHMDGTSVTTTLSVHVEWRTKYGDAAWSAWGPWTTGAEQTDAVVKLMVADAWRPSGPDHQLYRTQWDGSGQNEIRVIRGRRA